VGSLKSVTNLKVAVRLGAFAVCFRSFSDPNVSEIQPHFLHAVVFQINGMKPRSTACLCLTKITTYIYNIYIYIQGVPGGKDLTSGECSLGQTITI